MAVNMDVTSTDRAELLARATAYHEQGYNCAQSVVCALAPSLGIDADAAFRLAEGFGAGMGGMTETCGAISGALMAVGQASSTGTGHVGSKGHTYRLARSLCERFAQANGSTVCRELKGVGSDHGPLRSCQGCIDDALCLALDILEEDAQRSA